MRRLADRQEQEAKPGAAVGRRHGVAHGLRVTVKVLSRVPLGASLTWAVKVPAWSGVQERERLVDVPVVEVETVQLGMKSCRLLGKPAPDTVNVVATFTFA